MAATTRAEPAWGVDSEYGRLLDVLLCPPDNFHWLPASSIARATLDSGLTFSPEDARKQHAEMVKNVRKGDTVITSGGLVGRVTKVVDDDQIEVELAEGVRVRQMRSMVSDVRAKGEPVKDEG